MREPGDVLAGRYRLDRVLGRGGMGGVYLAWHLGLERHFALKAVEIHGANAEARRALATQFVVEAQMLQGLDHPGLPRVHQFFEFEGHHYLVMDYIEGVSLKQYLETGARPTEPEVLEWARQLCRVLGYLHTHDPQIIFRDLKPSNVMLKPDGHIKLIDFGIAKAIEGEASRTHTLIRGAGTAGFAAPEQYGGGTDARTDVYALGGTLYALVTGMTPPSVVDRAMDPKLRISVRAVNADVSEPTAHLIEVMMHMDPSRRPQTMDEILDLLGPDPTPPPPAALMARPDRAAALGTDALSAPSTVRLSAGENFPDDGLPEFPLDKITYRLTETQELAGATWDALRSCREAPEDGEAGAEESEAWGATTAPAWLHQPTDLPSKPSAAVLELPPELPPVEAVPVRPRTVPVLPAVPVTMRPVTLESGPTGRTPVTPVRPQPSASATPRRSAAPERRVLVAIGTALLLCVPVAWRLAAPPSRPKSPGASPTAAAPPPLSTPSSGPSPLEASTGPPHAPPAPMGKGFPYKKVRATDASVATCYESVRARLMTIQDYAMQYENRNASSSVRFDYRCRRPSDVRTEVLTGAGGGTVLLYRPEDKADQILARMGDVTTWKDASRADFRNSPFIYSAFDLALGDVQGQTVRAGPDQVVRGKNCRTLLFSNHITWWIDARTFDFVEVQTGQDSRRQTWDIYDLRINVHPRIAL